MLDSEKLTAAFWLHGIDKPQGLKAQFLLSLLVDTDERLNETDRSVFRFIVDWYVARYDSALASVDLITDGMRARAPRGNGPSRSAVHRAIVKLVKLGWLNQTKPTSRRCAARYAPEWRALEWAAAGNLPPVVSHPERDTNEPAQPTFALSRVEVVSHHSGTLMSHPERDTTAVCVPPSGTKTDLLDRPKGPALVSNDVSAAPSAPLADGLAATAAEAAGFDAAWQAYGKHGNKRASRAVWVAIAPETSLAARIAERAASWRRTAKPGSKRLPFEKWLEQERWDEADRYTPATDERLEVQVYFIEGDHIRVCYRNRRGYDYLCGSSADAVADAVDKAGVLSRTAAMVAARPGAFVDPANEADIVRVAA